MSEHDLHSQAEGDFRGKYGYGRPAHRTDPDAHYGFDPGAMPLLPTRVEPAAPQEEKADPPVELRINWPS